MATVRYTVVDGEVIAEKRGGARRTYVPDPLGSTVALLDNTQAKTDTFSYWPYGEGSSRTGTTATPFKFGGTREYYSSGLIILVNPFYSPQYGTWLSPGSSLDPFQRPPTTPTLSPPLEYGPWLPRPPTRPHRNPWRGVYNAYTASFEYGSYCGSSIVQNPGFQVLPQDPIDACCQIHDRCLEAHQGAGYSNYAAHQCCDAALYNCANGILPSNACWRFYYAQQNALGSSLANARAEVCVDAARQVGMGFGGLSQGESYLPCFFDCLPDDPKSKSFGGYVAHWWGDPFTPQPHEYR
jgi:hypothetical protein